MADRVEEFKGRVKETTGRVTADRKLEAEGKTEAERARTGRKAKGAAREVGGKVKEGVGKLTGDEATQLEGRAQTLRGRSQRTG